jgi:hypothetical protein
MAPSSEILPGRKTMAESSEIFFLEQELGLAAFRYFPGTITMAGSSEMFSWDKNYGW